MIWHANIVLCKSRSCARAKRARLSANAQGWADTTLQPDVANPDIPTPNLKSLMDSGVRLGPSGSTVCSRGYAARCPSHGFLIGGFTVMLVVPRIVLHADRLLPNPVEPHDGPLPVPHGHAAHDAHSEVDVAPGFVDAAAGDFQLTPYAAARKLGFVEIDEWVAQC